MGSQGSGPLTTGGGIVSCHRKNIEETADLVESAVLRLPPRTQAHAIQPRIAAQVCADHIATRDLIHVAEGVVRTAIRALSLLVGVSATVEGEIVGYRLR